MQVKQVKCSRIIGTGWCGGIRVFETADRLGAERQGCNSLQIRPFRLADQLGRYSTESSYPAISVVYICTRPSRPISRSRATCLKAGKHVLLEKPIALELWEADELITIARRGGLSSPLAIRSASSQVCLRQEEDHRRHARQSRLRDGEPASLRSLGKKIASRVKLSPG